MAYNSSHTGAQIDSAVGAVIEKESTWDSKGAGDMLASVYDPKGKAQDVFGYVDSTLTKMQPKIMTQGVLVGDGDGAVSAAPYEEWTFTLEDGSTVTKTIVLGW